MKKFLAAILILVATTLQAKALPSTVDSSVIVLKHDALSLVEVEWYERVRFVKCTPASGPVIIMIVPSTFYISDFVSTIFFCSKEGLIVQRNY
jgi:hypothetical protein